MSSVSFDLSGTPQDTKEVLNREILSKALPWGLFSPTTDPIASTENIMLLEQTAAADLSLELAYDSFGTHSLQEGTSFCGIYNNAATVSLHPIIPQFGFYCTTHFALGSGDVATTGNLRFYSGLMQNWTTETGEDNPVSEHIALSYNYFRGDTTWQVSYADTGAANHTLLDTGIPVTSSGIKLEIETESGDIYFVRILDFFTEDVIYSADISGVLAPPKDSKYGLGCLGEEAGALTVYVRTYFMYASTHPDEIVIP